MSEERHTVLVHEKQVQEYLDRGYRLEETSALDYLRSTQGPSLASNALLEVVFAEQRVMTIDAREFTKLNTPKRKFGIRVLDTGTVVKRLSVKRFDVLNEEAERRIVAASDEDESPREMFAHDLYDSIRECVLGNRSHLLAQAARYRAAADSIESFLRGHEAL